MVFHFLPKTKDICSIYLSWISQILREPYFNFCDRKISELNWGRGVAAGLACWAARAWPIFGKWASLIFNWTSKRETEPINGDPALTMSVTKKNNLLTPMSGYRDQHPPRQCEEHDPNLPAICSHISGNVLSSTEDADREVARSLLLIIFVLPQWSLALLIYRRCLSAPYLAQSGLIKLNKQIMQNWMLSPCYGGGRSARCSPGVARHSQ